MTDGRTVEDRGLTLALRIQRFEDPKAWRAQVDGIPDADERAVAERYLRDMVNRQRIAVQARRAAGGKA